MSHGMTVWQDRELFRWTAWCGGRECRGSSWDPLGARLAAMAWIGMLDHRSAADVVAALGRIRREFDRGVPVGSSGDSSRPSE